MRFRLAFAAMMFGLATCNRSAPVVDTTLPDANAADANSSGSNQRAATPRLATDSNSTFPCMGVDCRILTAGGWAGIRAGMRVRDAMRASGFSLRRPGRYDEFFADEPERLQACNIYGLVGGPSNLSVFVENGIVTSVSVSQDEGGGGPRFETNRGVGLGDTEAAVRRAYPRLEEEPDIYSEPPDKKLFFRDPNGHGIKFSIVGGRVVEIDVGARSINYVEGCL